MIKISFGTPFNIGGAVRTQHLQEQRFSLLHQVNNVDKIGTVRGQDVYETVGELKKLGLIT